MMVGRVRVDGELAALHPLPRNDPLAFLQVDFAPWRFDQFAGSDKHEQHQPQGNARRLEHAGFITFKHAKKNRQLVGINGREMRRLAGFEHVLHVHHEVAVSQAALDGVTENLRTYRLHAVRDLGRTALLDLAQRGDHVLVLELVDRPVADFRKDVGLKPLHHVLGCPLAPGRYFVGVPLAGNFLEGIGRSLGCEALGVVAVPCRVHNPSPAGGARPGAFLVPPGARLRDRGRTTACFPCRLPA